MNEKLLILGAGGHGRVVKETAEEMRCFEKIDFLDDYSELAIGKFKEYMKYINEYKYSFVGIGNNSERIRWLAQLKKIGYQLPVDSSNSLY